MSGYRIEQFTSIKARKLRESNTNNNSPNYRSPLHTEQYASHQKIKATNEDQEETQQKHQYNSNPEPK